LLWWGGKGWAKETPTPALPRRVREKEKENSYPLPFGDNGTKIMYY